MANAQSVVSAVTAASVAVASVDPSAAVAQTSPADPTPMGCLKGNGLKPWQPVPMRHPASRPASNKPRAALDRRSRVNVDPVAATATVDHVPNVASAMTAANAPSALNPLDERTQQPTKRPPPSRASLTSPQAHPRPTPDPARTSPPALHPYRQKHL